MKPDAALRILDRLDAVKGLIETDHHAANLRLVALSGDLRSAKQADPAGLGTLLPFRAHFLFNALNSVSALLYYDRAEATRTLDLLVAFLREALSEDSTEEIPLAREIDMARRYCAVEEVRFGDRLSLYFDVTAPSHAIHVPRFVLQPLVENSILYGVERIRGRGVIEIWVHSAPDAELVLLVRDRSPSSATWGGNEARLQEPAIVQLLERVRGRGRLEWRDLAGGGSELRLVLRQAPPTTQH